MSASPTRTQWCERPAALRRKHSRPPPHRTQLRATGPPSLLNFFEYLRLSADVRTAQYLHELDQEDAEQMINVNCRATVRMCKAVLPGACAFASQGSAVAEPPLPEESRKRSCRRRFFQRAVPFGDCSL